MHVESRKVVLMHLCAGSHGDAGMENRLGDTLWEGEAGEISTDPYT